MLVNEFQPEQEHQDEHDPADEQADVAGDQPRNGHPSPAVLGGFGLDRTQSRMPANRGGHTGQQADAYDHK